MSCSWWVIYLSFLDSVKLNGPNLKNIFPPFKKCTDKLILFGKSLARQLNKSYENARSFS